MMEDTEKLFMWSRQLHFRCRFQSIATELFNRVDINLQPKVFLLGISLCDRHKICFEPEDCGYRVDLFSDIVKLDPIPCNEKLVDSIKKILEREDLCGDTVKYVSSSTWVGGFLVFTVLELQKSTIGQYYSLNKKINHIRINRSFIESTIDVYLN